jgi:hypothetical protein
MAIVAPTADQLEFRERIFAARQTAYAAPKSLV